jgi:CDGSH-type Zn-finger protein
MSPRTLWDRLTGRREPHARATITPYADGPLLVRGSFTLLDEDGHEIDPGRATVALCRCGKSAIKPFCDANHKLARTSCGRSQRRRPARS